MNLSDMRINALRRVRKLYVIDSEHLEMEKIFEIIHSKLLVRINKIKI